MSSPQRRSRGRGRYPADARASVDLDCVDRKLGLQMRTRNFARCIICSRWSLLASISIGNWVAQSLRKSNRLLLRDRRIYFAYHVRSMIIHRGIYFPTLLQMLHYVNCAIDIFSCMTRCDTCAICVLVESRNTTKILIDANQGGWTTRVLQIMQPIFEYRERISREFACLHAKLDHLASLNRVRATKVDYNHV